MTIQTVAFVATRTKGTGELKQLLTVEQYAPGMTIADLIRLCHAEHPTESNGNISRFLSEFTGKFVRTQWVYNVLHTELKRK